MFRCLFRHSGRTQIQMQIQIQNKNSKNNKKKKPTVPDRRTDKTREYKYKYTESSKLHIIRTDDQSQRE